MNNFDKLEKCFNDYPSIVTLEQTKIIINQIENSICKIYKKKGVHGTGFLCYIENKKENGKMPVLITNNHIIGDKEIDENQRLKIFFKKENKLLDLNLDKNKKKIYTNKNYDITIIEIKKKEINSNSFLEIDDKVYMEGSENIFQSQSVYTIQYPEELSPSVSYGIIKGIDEKNEILHLCHTKEGSSGSPIINLNNNKVIGVHIGTKFYGNYNKGIFLNAPINDFFNNNSTEFKLKNNYSFFPKETYKDNINENQNKVFHSITIDSHNIINKNEIKITLKIESNEVNKEIYFLGNNKENNKLPNYSSELNSENTELLIGENKREYKQYFIPSKIGFYEIIIKFKKYLKNCSYMFSSCKQIIRIDLSNFKTKEVTDMSYMFYFCSNLKELNLSNLCTENVKNMSNMFSNCSKLSKINTSSFNIKNVNNMEKMFLNCRNLTNIDFSYSIASYNLDNSKIFEGCWKLKKLKLNRNSEEKFQKEIKTLQEQLIDKELNIEYV